MFLQAEVLTCWPPPSFWMRWSISKGKCCRTRAKRRREMELLEFDYPSAVRRVSRKAHVGVVGSGDMEVLMEPAEKDGAHVSIRTSVNGFGSTWKAVLDRFFSKFDGAVRIHINDAGATPGSVMLRLEQAAEVIEK